jgi:hypothetical protein
MMFVYFIKGSEAMVSLFVPCATQRLFFPDILTEYSRILYLDTDFIFLNSPHNTWKHFRQMDFEKRDVGMSIENADEKLVGIHRYNLSYFVRSI